MKCRASVTDPFLNDEGRNLSKMTLCPASSFTVDFPSSDPHARSTQPPPRPHLPFRRISLPSRPQPLHRQSVASVASFDSYPEDGSQPSSPISAAMRHINGGRVSKVRPISTDSPRRANKRRDVNVKPVDDVREAKRRKVIEEFYETERAYVDGLELIYSVSCITLHWHSVMS